MTATMPASLNCRGESRLYELFRRMEFRTDLSLSTTFFSWSSYIKA
jgi:hypothetical protein